MGHDEMVVTRAQPARPGGTSNTPTLDRRSPTPFRARLRRGWTALARSLSLFTAVGFGALGLTHTAAASDVTWPQGSTQFVNSTLTISNLTLCIEPGVTVKVSPGASIVVSDTGTLEVQGTDDEPVLFTVDGSGRWNGIQFQAGSPARVETAVREAMGVSVDRESPSR